MGQSLATKRSRLQSIVLYSFLVFWTAFSAFSLLWIVMSSFKTNKELYAGVWNLPQGFHVENYIKAWNVVNLRQYFLNSVLVTFGSIVALTFICTPAAYVLSRIKFKFSGFMNALFAVGMGIPYQLLLIPLYRIMLGTKLNDSLFGLGLVYVALSIPFTVYVLTGFIRTLPTSLEDAAMIDGCSEIGTFWKIMFPLSQPGVITVGILNFIFLWNEFMLALVFLNTDKNKTISLGLYTIQSAMQYTADWTGLFAAVMIVMLPTILIYVVLSEKIMAGITLGAVKG